MRRKSRVGKFVSGLRHPVAGSHRAASRTGRCRAGTTCRKVPAIAGKTSSRNLEEGLRPVLRSRVFHSSSSPCRDSGRRRFRNLAETASAHAPVRIRFDSTVPPPLAYRGAPDLSGFILRWSAGDNPFRRGNLTLPDLWCSLRVPSAHRGRVARAGTGPPPGIRSPWGLGSRTRPQARS